MMTFRGRGKLFIICFILISCSIYVYGIFTLHKISQNTTNIDHLQKRELVRNEAARADIRQANYRLCQRQNVLRATLQLVAKLNHQINLLPGGSPSHYVPLLDCTPTLIGQLETVLPADEARIYLLAFSRSEVDPVTGLAVP